MVAEPGRGRLEEAGIFGLESHLETARFTRGTCLMPEGSPGEACYFIVSGEVRV